MTEEASLLSFESMQTSCSRRKQLVRHWLVRGQSAVPTHSSCTLDRWIDVLPFCIEAKSLWTVLSIGDVLRCGEDAPVRHVVDVSWATRFAFSLVSTPADWNVPRDCPEGRTGSFRNSPFQTFGFDPGCEPWGHGRARTGIESGSQPTPSSQPSSQPSGSVGSGPGHRSPGCLIGQSRSNLLSRRGSIGEDVPSTVSKGQLDRGRMASTTLRPPCRFAPGFATHTSRATRIQTCKCNPEGSVDVMPQFPTNVGMYHLVRRRALEERDASDAFVSFCHDRTRKDGVERTLNVLRHPYGMDPCVALLCMWMPIAGYKQPLGEEQIAQLGKISDRWSWRLQRTLENARCQLEGEGLGGQDSVKLRAEIGYLESEVILAEQRHLHKTVKAAQFWSREDSELDPESICNSLWKVAAENLRIYLRYMGLPHTPQIIRHITDLNVACLGEDFERTEFVHTLSPNTVRPRTLEQDKKMYRYHLAKQAHKEAWEDYKEAQKELRRTRRISSIARHELYRSRKEVRQVWR